MELTDDVTRLVAQNQELKDTVHKLTAQLEDSKKTNEKLRQEWLYCKACQEKAEHALSAVESFTKDVLVEIVRTIQ
jgi:cell division septum initiation protein DivIVA